jgi:hypothetical protein
MTGFLVLAALVITVVTVLELSHRRHSEPFTDPRRVQRGIEDRDRARTRLDLLALAGRAEPFAHKPFTVKDHWPDIGYGDSDQSPLKLAG